MSFSQIKHLIKLEIKKDILNQDDKYYFNQMGHCMLVNNLG
jgi:hypothetical protein